MNFTIEPGAKKRRPLDSEVLALRGTLVYEQTRQEAIARGQALALRVLVNQLEHGEANPRV
jgi:hypothetical protein